MTGFGKSDTQKFGSDRKNDIIDDASINQKTDSTNPDEVHQPLEDKILLPALKKYLENLNDPNIVSTVLYSEGHNKERVEHFADIISDDIYKTVDPRSLILEDHDKVKQEIISCIDLIAEHREYKISKKERKIIEHIIQNDMFGLGPLEVILDNDDISDIMVCGPYDVFIEVEGKIKKTDIHFRNEQHLINICHRIVSRVGRHVDESSPICDARLPDGSRVNVILPPLALDGANLTIRKFKKDKLTLDKLVKFGSIDERTQALLEILAASRVNVLVSGGTGSGKTTLLNCLTKYIYPSERIITCEDSAELQLQQPQVVRLETRPPNIEGVGAITMRDLVRNCLRMRPERIIVGEVRGPEAFDLLQAMNTGHDGSMGTLHANTPRDALFRLENMIAMANLSIPNENIREQIASSLDVVVHMQRMRDGSRKVTHITEITGMEEGVVSMQDLMSYEILGEDKDGNMIGKFLFNKFRPKFYEKAIAYNLEKDLLSIMMLD